MALLLQHGTSAAPMCNLLLPPTETLLTHRMPRGAPARPRTRLPGFCSAARRPRPGGSGESRARATWPAIIKTLAYIKILNPEAVIAPSCLHGSGRTRAASHTSPWLLQRGTPAAPGWKRRKPCARCVAARVRRPPPSAPGPAVTWPSVYASRVLQLAVRRSSGSLRGRQGSGIREP